MCTMNLSCSRSCYNATLRNTFLFSVSWVLRVILCKLSLIKCSKLMRFLKQNTYCTVPTKIEIPFQMEYVSDIVARSESISSNTWGAQCYPTELINLSLNKQRTYWQLHGDQLAREQDLRDGKVKGKLVDQICYITSCQCEGHFSYTCLQYHL